MRGASSVYTLLAAWCGCVAGDWALCGSLFGSLAPCALSAPMWSFDDFAVHGALLCSQGMRAHKRRTEQHYRNRAVGYALDPAHRAPPPQIAADAGCAQRLARSYPRIVLRLVCPLTRAISLSLTRAS